MPKPFRIASFNVENLFSRAKVLNLADHVETDRLLSQVAQLKTLLAKPTYAAPDKVAIKALLSDLKAYVEVREDRGKLLNKLGSVTAAGAGDWDGMIEFKRADIDEMARVATADVLKALKADVVCVVEAESRGMLQQFNSQAMGTKKFPRVLLIDGNDERGIDVGLFTKLELGRIETHVYDRDAKGEIFSRDCLEVELLSLPNGEPLHLLCNHLKSQGYGDQAANDAKRKRQTTRLVSILAKYDLAKDFVVVAGDMNDKPASDAMKPLLSVPNLFDVLDLQFGADAAKRWTYRYSGKGDQIDFLLVSKPLRDAFKQAGVERRGIWGIKKVTGEDGFASVTSKTTAASDHGAVWAEFSL